MKKIFEDGSYIEINKKSENLIISIGAKDFQNSRKIIINSVEIAFDEVLSYLRSAK